MTDIVMPRLSDSMEEGTVLQWMKEVGDEGAVGEELVEIETDKANVVYEADSAGTLVKIIAREGETLPIGSVIARVGDFSEAPGAGGDGGCNRASSAVSALQGARVAARDTPPTTAAIEPRNDGGNGRFKASPLARRIAGEREIDLTTLAGSGPGGRIVKADVERAASGSGPVMLSPLSASPAPSPSAALPAPPPFETARGQVEVVEPTKPQQTVARRMAESKATAPHFYLQAYVDMSAAISARSRLKAQTPEGEAVPSFNDMVLKACAITLRATPRANGAYRDGKLELYSRVNVGIAVAAQNALVVPTIFDADRKGLRQIATEARALAARVREGTVTPPELSGGTFTVSNLGMYGISNFHAVINPPQAAILAVGAITETPVVRDSEIATAHLMGFTLACDHRILYGAEAAEFLGRIQALLEEPLGLAS